MSEFRLSVYAYAPESGAPNGMAQSHFTTPAAAAAAIAAHTEPFSHAVLHQWAQGAWVAARFDGRPAHGQFDIRIGANYGVDHPALTALKTDWSILVKEVAELHRGTGERLATLAARVLAERHPNIIGWAERLAQAAYAHAG